MRNLESSMIYQTIIGLALVLIPFALFALILVYVERQSNSSGKH